jgi:hypothetical protein
MEWSDSLVTNKLFRAYMQAVADGQTEIAQNILAELRKLNAQQVQGGKQAGQTARPNAQEMASMSTPGSGMPTGETGLPASTMPAEAMGGLPPGASNAQ